MPVTMPARARLSMVSAVNLRLEIFTCTSSFPKDFQFCFCSISPRVRFLRSLGLFTIPSPTAHSTLRSGFVTPAAYKVYSTGEKYIFKKLPEGYRTYTKSREDGRQVSNHGHGIYTVYLSSILKDRYVFGHPRGRFDSPNKFATHFKWLMQGGIGTCNCVRCKGPIMRNSSMSFTAPARAAVEPDVNDLSAQLERFANYFEENPDDMGEYRVAWEGPPPWGPHELLDGQSFEAIAAKYLTLPSFLPRKGELVLFYLEEEHGCWFEDSTQQFKMFSEASGEFLGFPTWRAGVVATEPETKPDHEDLSGPPHDRLEVASKSFQIELYPDPDSRDKSFSGEIYMVHLDRIRPLSMFHELLSGIPQMEWHVTIHNALKSMNTVCLVDPIEFAGKWLSYSIRCRGIWIGSELYVTGDAVRLLPARGKGTDIDQVLVINRIDYRFENDNVHDESSSIVVAGPVITINKERSFQDTPFTVAEKRDLLLPASTAGYKLYPSDVSTDGHLPEADYEGFLGDWQEVPISYIAGRLYDLEAMKILLNIVNFDIGGLGITKARRWAKKHRTCMKANAHEEWILTVDRIQALDIETLNGRAVGKGAEREKLEGRKGSRQSTEVYSGRVQKGKSHFSGGSSSQPSNKYNGNNGNDASGEERGDILQISDLYDDVQNEINSQAAPSLKSIVTDRSHNWSQDEGEDGNANAEGFISETIARDLLTTDEEEMDGDRTDETQNGNNPQCERPVKRPRI
jgi:hypothetical protein